MQIETNRSNYIEKKIDVKKLYILLKFCICKLVILNVRCDAVKNYFLFYEEYCMIQTETFNPLIFNYF